VTPLRSSWAHPQQHTRTQMAKIVWLASYPKSGNTWLRFMLANLIYGKPATSSAEVRALVPDIHDGVPGLQLFGNRTTIIKTHWAFNTALRLREDVVGVIHLVRNPIEVMESNQNYAMTRSGELYRKVTDSKLQEMAAGFVDEFIRHGGHKRFKEFGIGSWEEHTLSWTSKINVMPRCGIRYEDLVADPQTQCRRLLEHCGLPWEDQVLDFHRSAKPSTTASAMQVRRPIYRSSVQKWRNFTRELEPVVRRLAEAGLVDTDGNPLR